MDPKEVFDSFYEDCLKIHAICDDLGYSRDDARLLTAIHYLANQKGQDFFLKKSFENEILAIDVLLSNRKPRPMSNTDIILSDICSGLELQILENSAEAGDRECFFTTQLKVMKKFYQNAEFRNEKFRIYREIIKPKIAEYDSNKVARVFERAREKEVKERKEINRLTSFGGFL